MRERRARRGGEYKMNPDIDLPSKQNEESTCSQQGRSKMWTGTAALSLAVLVTAVSALEPNCTELGFDEQPESFPGSDLPVCQTMEEQCCSEDYLDDVQDRVREKLEKFLRLEFEDVVLEYLDELDNLIEYFNRYLPLKLLQNLPFSDVFAQSPLIRPIIENLLENIEIDEDDEDEEEDDEDEDFDEGNFVQSLLRGLTRVGAGVIVVGNEDSLECVIDVIDSSIDGRDIRTLRRELRVIRRGVTALMRIGRFLERRLNSQNIRVLDRCVRRFTEIAFCGRCTRKTPPLCYRTCNAFVRGCYSPYYSGLKGQYVRLWGEVKRIFALLNQSVEDLGSIELIDINTVISEVGDRCGVVINNRNKRQQDTDDKGRPTPRRRDGTPGRGTPGRETPGRGTTGSRSRSEGSGSGMEDLSKTSGTSPRSRSKSTRGPGSKSQSDSTAALDIAGDLEFIPRALVDDVFELNGAFEYGRRGGGLRFCYEALNDDNDTCPMDDSGSEKYCDGNEICTSRCTCFDGRNDTRDNETDVFEDSDVEGQGENSLLGISVAELEEERDRIAAIDTVASFLASDEFNSVDPANIEDDDESPEEAEEGSAAGLGVSLCGLFLTIMTIFLS